MTVGYIRCELQDGFIDHWLVAGPQAIPVHNLADFSATDLRAAILSHYSTAELGFIPRPVEPGPPGSGRFTHGAYKTYWSYRRCREDHFIDHSSAYPIPHYLRSWSYAELMSGERRTLTLVLSSHAAVDLWLNGRHIHRQDLPESGALVHVPLQVNLRQGPNKLLLRCESVALPESRHTLAVRIRQADPPADEAELYVRLASAMDNIARRNRLEQAFEYAFLDREVFERNDQIVLRWPEDAPVSAVTAVRLQTPDGRIYAESYNRGTPGEQANLGSAGSLPAGPYRVVLMPNPREYYEGNQRIRRELSLWSLGNNSYSPLPYGSLAERRHEALRNAAGRNAGLFSEIARLALGQWDELDHETFLSSLQRVRERQAGSVVELLGLLGLSYRFAGQPQFPAGLRAPLAETILGFRYWLDQPGADGMCFTSESRQILFHTCEILAGQLYPEQVFTNSGQNGRWHRAHGEQMALAWLRARGATGFGDWDSAASFADDLLALSHLVDLAESDPVWELAAVLIDKLLFTIASNSYRGVFGSTHRRAAAAELTSGLLEPTSGITRLLWGQGIFNHHLAGTVALACMEQYELPPIIAQIACSAPEEFWGRERHRAACSEQEAAAGVDKVTYRTPDYMLSSAQDYAPGRSGAQEHIWQATLSHDAVVFVTHPGCAAESAAGGPSFWAGNATLPRVAQWKDVLIAVHRLPQDDWMGFTHAYFPLYAFDEYALRDGWAYARKGAAYLALTAAQGLELVQQGPTAYRELRSYGQHNVWLCQMGRAAQDGSFADFQQRLQNAELVFGDLAVRYTSLRGDSLAFAWSGPLYRNNQVEPLAGLLHYDNNYTRVELPCREMEIRLGEEGLRLIF